MWAGLVFRLEKVLGFKVFIILDLRIWIIRSINGSGCKLSPYHKDLKCKFCIDEGYDVKIFQTLFKGSHLPNNISTRTKVVNFQF